MTGLPALRAALVATSIPLAVPLAVPLVVPMAAAGELSTAAGRVGARAPAPDAPTVPCPAQTDRTMVALLLGQSNAANHGSDRSVSRRGVVGLFDGTCRPAADPLPGGTGDGGSPWPRLGDALIETGAFDRVVLIPAAINGAEIARWAPGGDLAPWLDAVVGSVGDRYRITHVFWVQGESDLLLNTSAEAYRASFLALRARLRALGVDAPIRMTVTSGFCGRPKMGVPSPPDNPVVTAQRSLIASEEDVVAGPDTDALLSDPADRHDGCHMTARGVEKLTKAWAPILAGRRPPSARAPR